MNGGRGSFDPPAGAARPRASRLSRSLRQTQTGIQTRTQTQTQTGIQTRTQTQTQTQTGTQTRIQTQTQTRTQTRTQTGTRTQAEAESPWRPQPDLKTPSRVQRSRPAAESPVNDGDFQQDIFWDATSPHGKRGRKTSRVVDISEIVSRIAPKHGRPTVAEPTLQQWIGDSAAIPCTPDLHPPKPKKKSPRPNAVEDLLKLARQFDFSLFHQEADEEENQNQQNPELLSENVRVFNSSESSASLPGSCRPTEKAATRTEVQLDLDQNLEDDLDLLFDGPTQHVSRTLSQASAAPTSGPTEFEDDWEHDDLLDDSLLLEMTQNPQNFTTPKHCSTQKPDQGTPGPPGPTAGKENRRPRTTFKLESPAGFSGGGIPTDSRTKQQNSAAAGGGSRSAQPEPRKPQNLQTPQLHRRVSAAASSTAETPAASEDLELDPDLDLDSLFSLDPVWDDPADDNLLCEMCEHLENQMDGLDNVLSNQSAALQWTSRTQKDPIQPPQKHSAGPAGSSLAARGPAGSSLAAAGPTGVPLAARGPAGSSLAARGPTGVPLAARGPTGVPLAARGPAGVSLAAAGPAGVPLAARGPTGVSLAARGPTGVSLAAAGPAGVPLAARGPAGVSLAAAGPAGVSLAARGPTGVSLAAAGPAGVPLAARGPAGVPLAARGPAGIPLAARGPAGVSLAAGHVSLSSVTKENFTFKRPNNPVSMTTTNKAKCSAAEIELKKQQAMERRRQRLQAQNHPEPT